MSVSTRTKQLRSAVLVLPEPLSAFPASLTSTTSVLPELSWTGISAGTLALSRRGGLVFDGQPPICGPIVAPEQLYRTGYPRHACSGYSIPCYRCTPLLYPI